MPGDAFVQAVEDASVALLTQRERLPLVRRLIRLRGPQATVALLMLAACAQTDELRDAVQSAETWETTA